MKITETITRELVALQMPNGCTSYVSKALFNEMLRRTGTYIKDGYLCQETTEIETAYNEKLIDEILALIKTDTPMAKFVKHLIYEVSDASYYMPYRGDEALRDMIKLIPQRYHGANIFPELVQYKTVKKVNKAKIIG